MIYQGSKNKIAKHILPIILKDRKERQWYVEPFMGGGNMIDKVDGLRIGNDLNYHLIEMWRALQNGWLPPDEISEAEYKYLKAAQDIEDPALVAFAGFLVSFGGKWMAGYARDKDNNNYAARGKRALIKQLPQMMGVELYDLDYRDLDIPEGSIIYCDPPYRGTTGYKFSFDNDIFWQWCRDKSLDGHRVYISEYNAPPDFRCLLEIDHFTTLTKTNKDKRVEKLFIFNEFY